MEASRNQNPNRTEFQAADDAIDTQPTPVAPAEIDRERYSCPELASTVTSSAVNEFQCEINDDLKYNDASSKKKKKKKKKKKTNPGSPDTTADTIDENVQGDHPATSTTSTEPLIQKAEVDVSFQESASTVSSALQEGEREGIQEGSLPGKKKKKKKKKKKAQETGDFDVSVLSLCDANSSSPSNDRVSSQALSSDSTVQEARREIKTVIAKDPRDQESTITDETVSERTSDQQELLLTIPTTSGQNVSRITGEHNTQGDSSGKTKKKRKKKKKQEVEYNILSDSESGVVLATGRAEIERVNLLQVVPGRSCTTEVVQQQSQNANDAEALTTQANTQLLCVHDVSAIAGDTLEQIKPDEESSSTSQSLREE